MLKLIKDFLVAGLTFWRNREVVPKQPSVFYLTFAENYFLQLFNTHPVLTINHVGNYDYRKVMEYVNVDLMGELMHTIESDEWRREVYQILNVDSVCLIVVESCLNPDRTARIVHNYTIVSDTFRKDSNMVDSTSDSIQTLCKVDKVLIREAAEE